MSGCEFYQELISRMIDEDLDRAEQALLAEHLKTCADCRRMYAAFSALSTGLGGDLEEPPETLRENVMAQLRRSAFRLEEPEERRTEVRAEKVVPFHPAQNQKKNSRSPYRGFVAVAASLALVIGASFLAAPLLRMGANTAVTGGGAASQNMAPAAYQSINGGQEAHVTLDGSAEENAPADRSLSMAETATEGTAAAPAYEYEAETALPQPTVAPAAANADAAADAGGTLSIAAPADADGSGIVCSYVELWDEGRQDDLLALLKGAVRPMAIPLEDDTTVEEEELAEFLVYVLSLDEKGERQISVYVKGGSVYYLDTADGVLRTAVCTPGKLAEFIF